MKHLGVILVFLVLATPGYAQAVPQTFATIPFAFELNGIVLGPGEYQLLYMEHLTLIRNIDQPRKATLFCVEPWPAGVNAKVAFKLVFNKYADRHFLSQAWVGQHYYQLPRSRQERELVTSSVVSRNSRPETVVLAARVVR